MPETEIKTNIAKNTSYLTVAMIIQRIFSLIYFTILARELGPENLGKYYLAISFTLIFSIVSDLGLNSVLTREASKNKTEAKNIFANIMGLKVPLSLLAIIITLIGSHFSGYDPLVKNLIVVSLIAVILDSFSNSFFSVARAFHNLKYESISAAAYHAIVIIFGLTFLFSGLSLVYLMLALTIASLFQFIFSFFIVSYKIGVPFGIAYNRKMIKEIILITIPFSLTTVIQRIYAQFDTLLLGYMTSALYVGYYQIPFRIISALQFFPSAFSASLYPAMSHFWTKNRPRLQSSFEKSIIYLSLISLPITAGVFFLADKIILLFKSGYSEAVLPMQIIILALFFIFVNFPIGALISACDRQKDNTLIIGIITVVGVVLDIILIPHFKVVGASFTVLITNSLSTILGIWRVKKIISFDGKKIISAVSRTFCAALLMGVIVFYLKSYLSIFLIVPIGAIIYFISLFIFRSINKDDILYFKDSFFKNES